MSHRLRRYALESCGHLALVLGMLAVIWGAIWVQLSEEPRYDRAQYALIGCLLSMLALAVSGLLLWQRTRLERSRNELGITLENISQGILMADHDGRVLVINRRAIELLGLPPGLTSRAGVNYDDILHWQVGSGTLDPQHDGSHAAAAPTRQTGLDAAMPVYEYVTSIGTVLEIRTALLGDGGAVRTYTDITDRKRFERDIAAARDAAEAAGRVRAEFLAVMSHEIRTPLNGIIAAAGLLLDMQLPSSQLEYVRIIRESGDHLLVLINDILDFTRLEAERLALEEVPFDLRGTIAGAMELLAARAQSKRLMLDCSIADDVPARLVGDPGRLRQVLLNLLDNGIKFTAKGAVRLAVRCVANNSDGARLAFAISDSGIGIAATALDKLFKQFSQVDGSISRQFGGSGLGLAICRRLVERMGGTISVSSTQGKGSIFRFDVVLREAGATADAQPAAAPIPYGHSASSANNLRVLIAEDDNTNRLVATRMVERMGHRVDGVADGAEVVRAARFIPYDLILMDVMMPNTDGIAATRLIRSEPPPCGTTPIIGLTANVQPEDEQACRAAGMDGFVTKPITLDRLSAAIAEVMARCLPVSPTGFISALPIVDEAFLSNLAEEIGADGPGEAIALFLEDAPLRLGVLQRAMADGEADILRREAHALAGAARNVGLIRLGTVAGSFQKAVEAAEPDQAQFDALIVVLRETIARMEVWEAQHRAAA